MDHAERLRHDLAAGHAPPAHLGRGHRAPAQHLEHGPARRGSELPRRRTGEGRPGAPAAAHGRGLEDLHPAGSGSQRKQQRGCRALCRHHHHRAGGQQLGGSLPRHLRRQRPHADLQHQLDAAGHRPLPLCGICHHQEPPHGGHHHQQCQASGRTHRFHHPRRHGLHYELPLVGQPRQQRERRLLRGRLRGHGHVHQPSGILQLPLRRRFRWPQQQEKRRLRGLGERL